MSGKILLCFAFFAVFLPMLGQQAPTMQTTQPVADLSPAKVAWVDIDRVIMSCGEGKRDLEELQNYIYQKTKQGEALGKEANDLKTQLDLQGAKLTDEAREDLEDQLEAKNVQLQRFQQDTQGQIDKRRTRIANRIIRKAQLLSASIIGPFPEVYFGPT
jgi:Skp family chaperone for outer membrane proteins